MKAQQPASIGRIIATPVICMVAGYLVGGLAGLAVGAAVGILYVMVASSRK